MPSVRRMSLLVLGMILVLIPAGCTGNRPKAPALEEGNAYQNETEGIRFLVPQGWSQQTRATLPPGKVDRERLLVLYRQLGSKPPASLELIVNDIPESTDIVEYVSNMRRSGYEWKLVGKPSKEKVGSQSGDHFRLEGVHPKSKTDKPLHREVTAIRKGERVYFFVGTWSPTDQTSRVQVRSTFEAVQWKE